MHQGRLREESVAALDAVYRRDGRRIFASLVRLLGSFKLAEDAEHDAFIAAAEHWPRDGVPANPVGWLISVGRSKAIDRQRRHARFASIDDHTETIEQIAGAAAGESEQEPIEDDRLHLIFTCCHPKRRALRSRCATSAALPPRTSPAPSSPLL